MSTSYSSNEFKYWDVPTGEYVQILHISVDHWRTISNINITSIQGFSANSVNVYDSMYSSILEETKVLIGQYTKQHTVKINIMNVQQ